MPTIRPQVAAPPTSVPVWTHTPPVQTNVPGLAPVLKKPSAARHGSGGSVVPVVIWRMTNCAPTAIGRITSSATTSRRRRTLGVRDLMRRRRHARRRGELVVDHHLDGLLGHARQLQ